MYFVNHRMLTWMHMDMAMPMPTVVHAHMLPSIAYRIGSVPIDLAQHATS